MKRGAGTRESEICEMGFDEWRRNKSTRGGDVGAGAGGEKHSVMGWVVHWWT